MRSRDRLVLGLFVSWLAVAAMALDRWTPAVAAQRPQPGAFSTLTTTSTSVDSLHVGCAVGSSSCTGGIKSGPIKLSATVPADTTTSLYNSSGTLTWAGTALLTGTLGLTQNQAFSASDYSASAGTWTVGSGNVLENNYRIIGDTMFWSIATQGGASTGSPVFLLIKIPGGKSKDGSAVCSAMNVSGASPVGTQYVSCASGGDNTHIGIGNLATWPNPVANVAFQIFFKIQ